MVNIIDVKCISMKIGVVMNRSTIINSQFKFIKVIIQPISLRFNNLSTEIIQKFIQKVHVPTQYDASYRLQVSIQYPPF